MNDDHADLLDVLERERVALLGGQLSELADLSEQKLRLLPGLGSGKHAAGDHEHLVILARRNQELMKAAAEGLREAVRRIAELKLLQEGRGTYSENGARDAITSAPIRHDRRA